MIFILKQMEEIEDILASREGNESSEAVGSTTTKQYEDQSI